MKSPKTLHPKGDPVLSHNDPLSVVYAHYNPAIVHAFKQALKHRSSNTTFNNVMITTERALRSIQKQLGSKTTFSSLTYSYLPLSVISARGHIEHLLLGHLNKINDIEELKGIAAAMQMLCPQSAILWQTFDRKTYANIEHYDFEFLLLASFAISHATKQLGLSMMKTPRAVVEKLIEYAALEYENEKKGRSNRKRLNIFDVAFPFSQHQVNNNNKDNVLDDIQKQETTDFMNGSGVDMLGLKMHLIASQPWALTKSGMKKKMDGFSDRRRVLEDLIMHSVHILNNLHEPVRLNNLKVIWEVAPILDLPDAYDLYKTLYNQVLLSIEKQPLQIVQHENVVCSLFESMTHAKFKSSQLVQKVYNIVQERGVDVKHVGVRLFNSLVQLEALPFSLMIMENIMKYSSMKLESIFSHSSAQEVRLMSDSGKEVCFKYLTERHQSEKAIKKEEANELIINSDEVGKGSNSSADVFGKSSLSSSTRINLILALLYFSRDEKRTPPYRLLEQLEHALPGRLDSFSGDDCVMMMHSYGLAGRFHPRVIESIEQHLIGKINGLGSRQLSTLLWVCGRLNYKPSYLNDVIQNYFQSVQGLSVLSSIGGYQLSRSLWSLAALELLTPQHFLSVHHLLMRSFDKGFGMELNSWMLRQMTQVLIEVKLLQESSKTSLEIKSQLEKASEEVLKCMQSSTAWQYLERRLKEGIVSKIHLDASSILNEFGISHENEKIIEGCYSVDTFISTDAIGIIDPNCKGLIIEYDGPNHFETYLNQPLGPTVMKHRHLRARGYLLITLPFWEYKMDMTREQKVKVIKRVIAQVVE
eukprot:gene538-579_t